VVCKALGVVRVLGAVVTDKVVRQFVAESDPPVRHGFDQAFRGIHVSFVQLLKEAQVAENASVLIESNRTALLVSEDVERGNWEVEDRGTVREQNVERSESRLMVSEEDLRVCGVTRKEELHALSNVTNECEVVAGFAVTVCRRLFDLIGLWSAEERVCGVRA
jgi:hypothetical protein